MGEQHNQSLICQLPVGAVDFHAALWPLLPLWHTHLQSSGRWYRCQVAAQGSGTPGKGSRVARSAAVTAA